MKTKLLLLTAVFGLASSVAFANLYTHNDQTFTAGNIVGQNGWAAHSGAGSVPVQINSDGEFILAHGSSSREDVNINVGSFTAGNTYYAGFNLSVDGGASVTNAYFAHFLEGTSTFRSRVWVTNHASGDYTLAFGNASSIESTWADGLSFNTDYTIMMSFDFDSGASSLWVNPIDESSTSISAIASTSPLSAMAFRQAGGNSTQTISSLAVGTDFSETLSAIPEPSVAALLLIGMGFLFRFIRKQK